MYCRKCGAEIRNEAKFCHKCGYKIEDSEKNIITTEESSKNVRNVEKTIEELPQNTNKIEKTVEKRIADTNKTEKKKQALFGSKSADGKKKAEKPVPSKSSDLALLRKRIISYAVTCIVFLAIWAVPITAGVYLFPKLITPMLIKNSAETKLKNKEYGNAIILYNIFEDNENVLRSKYKQAEKLINDNKYAEACAVLVSLDNRGYNDEDELIEQAFSERCKELIQNGGYNYAMFDSEKLTDVSLKKAILNDAYICRAAQMSNDQKYEEAYRLLEKVDKSVEYDSAKYNITVYNYAVSLYNEKKFEDACNAFETIKSYSDSEKLYQNAAYNAANEFLNNNDYQNALNYYEKLGDYYGDSLDRKRECSYRLGVDSYNQGDYEEAKNYFSDASGYEDSAQYINKCNDKLKYSGWYLDDVHLCTGYYETYSGEYVPVGETARFSTYDDIYIIFKLKNTDSKKNSYIDLKVTVYSPDGYSDSSILYDMSYNYQAGSVWAFEYPSFAPTGSAHYTISIKDTGEELGTYYFYIY